MNSDAEQAVLRAIERLGGLNTGVNELSVSYACPSLDVYAVLRELDDRGIVEHKGAAVRIVPEADRKPTVPALVEEPRNEPRKPRKPRKPQFARLDHSKNLVKQVASRIVEFLSHAGPVKNEVLYNALHAYKLRAKYFGRDLWLEALKNLGRSIRIKDGMTELVNEMVSEKLPSPYPKEKVPRKRKPRTAWFKDVAARADAAGLPIREQMEIDRKARQEFRRNPAGFQPSRGRPVRVAARFERADVELTRHKTATKHAQPKREQIVSEPQQTTRR